MNILIDFYYSSISEFKKRQTGKPAFERVNTVLNNYFLNKKYYCGTSILKKISNVKSKKKNLSLF